MLRLRQEPPRSFERPLRVSVLRREDGKRYIEIDGRRIGVGGPLPAVREGERLIRYTGSICPYCLRLLPAVIVARGGRLYIRKKCPEHGEIEDLYYGDERFYWRQMKWEETGLGLSGAGPYTTATAPCPYACGLCSLHENHSALVNIVVTNRCDLSCFYCFFYAERAGYIYEPSIEQIKFMVRQVARQRQGSDVHVNIQITGGEPTVREDLVDVVKAIREAGAHYIQLNTNGINVARRYLDNPPGAIDYVRSLREAGVSVVYMSFDGVTPKVNWKNHYEAPFALKAFQEGGLDNVVLVPTVIRTINDHEVGDIIRFAGKHIDVVRGVNFQPVSLTGMMRKHERERMRITIPDVIKRIEEQTDGQIPMDAWYPVPVVAKFVKAIDALTGKLYDTLSNHPACGSATYVFALERDRYGVPRRFLPITEVIDVEGFIEFLDEERIKLEHNSGRLSRLKVAAEIVWRARRFVDFDRMPRDLDIYKLIVSIFLRKNYEAIKTFHKKTLFLGMMHFMDRYNYDITRVRRCNIHYALPDGRLVPFCAFNVLEDIYRDNVQKRFAKAKNLRIKGFNPGEKYDRRRYIKRILESPIYREAYRGIIDVDAVAKLPAPSPHGQ
ncbi:conserved hypothetical protein [Aeropyrum pernix K1]|uniref:Radical SAM core domain-containing protein n=1 Tax=Aeropyrum pernix (strain ATCC 700893 / DSM 11879 / JCM 9820 / NBRC 100138 / K1) TaxID=272557 RepID=Q9Y8N5_AERPE|nr:radical SAM protein [Aeropyrum pernix]BAA81615.1 conserved hypothetical protein [Aeropyrum pernix K1]